MSRLLLAFLLLASARGLSAQIASDQLSELPKPHDYALKRSSSYDRTGGNADAVLGNVEKRLNSAREAPRISSPFDGDFLTRCLPTRTTPAPLHGLEQ